jgi:hypothetical protein
MTESNPATKLLPNQVQIKNHNDEFVDLIEGDENDLDVTKLPTSWFGRTCRPSFKKFKGIKNVLPSETHFQTTSLGRT